jgi:hypothetical protein
MNNAGMSNRKSCSTNSGMALVITLLAIVMVTLIVVAFSVSARIERRASSAGADALRAQEAAAAALSHATALLAKNIPAVGDAAPDPPINWWVNPGRLTLRPANGTTRHIALHSGEVATALDDDGVNLNERNRTRSGYLIEPTGSPMRVRWIYLPRDPSAPHNSATNPYVARYAFWVDDENGKLDVNTALGRSTTADLSDNLPSFTPQGGGANLFTLGHHYGTSLALLEDGSKVNFNALFQSRRGNKPGIILPTTGGGPGVLAAVEEFGRFITPATDAQDFVEKNRFQLTAWSRDPEFNVFGESRTFLNRAINGESLMPWHQYSWDNSDANTFNPNLSIYNWQLTQNAVEKLANAFARSDWPGHEGSSLAGKWGGTEEAAQVAWNIQGMADLGNTDLNPNAFSGTTPITSHAVSDRWMYRPHPSTGAPNTAWNSAPPLGRCLWDGPGATGSRIFQQTRSPLINEIGLTVDSVPGSAPGTYRIRITLEVELFLPEGYDGKPIVLAPFRVAPSRLEFAIDDGPLVSVPLNETNPSNNNGPGMLTPTLGGSLSPGDYLRFSSGLVDTVDRRFVVTMDLVPGVYTLNRIKLKLVLFNGGYVFQYAPVRQRMEAPMQGTETATASEPGLVSLPDIDVVLGPVPAPVTRTVEILDPRLAHLSSKWETSPHPSGHTLGGANALLDSAEQDRSKLAFVPVSPSSGSSAASRAASPEYRLTSPGWISLIHTGMRGGHDYRSLKFHGDPPAGMPPDFLVMDLVAPHSPFTHNNATAGRVNINSRIYPQNAQFQPPTRRAPLAGVFDGLTMAGSPLDPIALAGDIAAGEPPEGFAYVGEITRLSAVSGTGSDAWEREAIARNLIGTLTTKSNSFGVWGVGQAISEQPGDRFIVLGESRFFAVIQREVWRGVDGVVGNARANASGEFTEAGGTTQPTPGDLRDMIDGPDAPDIGPFRFGPGASDVVTPNHSPSPILSSHNPLRPRMHFKTVFHKNLIE